MKNLIILSFFIALSAQAKNTFGRDDRQAITSNAYPWSTIGYVDDGANHGCTGTLVSRNIVLTAAHCVIDPATKEHRKTTFTFYPNMISSNSLKSSTAKQLVWGTNDPNKFRAHDWAFLVLNDNLGDTYGWMGTNQNYNYDNGYVNMAGYSGNFMNGQTAGVHINCNFRGPSEGFVLHDCDSSRGSSGGPMFFTNVKNESTIVAINVGERRDGGDTSLFLGEYEETHANVAVYASKFLPKLKELLK